MDAFTQNRTAPARRRSIALVNSHLGLGGAERVMSLMANYWVETGASVHLFTLTHGERPPLHHLDEHVDWRDLDFPEVRRAAPPKLRTLACVRALRGAIEAARPDVVISFLNTTNIFTLMASMAGWPLHAPVIVSERVHPAYEPLGWRWRQLRRCLYPSAASLVVQTTDALDYFSTGVRRRARVIPNPVLPMNVGRTAHQKSTASKLVVGVGRLAEQKRFDWLLRAFASVCERRPDWRLEIWGEGHERDRLARLIQELGIGERAALCGRTERIEDVFSHADLFVLSSMYEGFPNALCEALACGVPSISFDCPSGPRDVLREGQDGLLVPTGDVEGLARAMDRLMGDEAERQALAARGPQIVDRLSLHRVMSMWDSLVEDVIH